MQRTDSLCSTRSDEGSSALSVLSTGFRSGRQLQAVIVSIPVEPIGETSPSSAPISGSLSAGAAPPFAASGLLTNATTAPEPVAPVSDTTITNESLTHHSSSTPKPVHEVIPDTGPKPAPPAAPVASAPKVTYACNLRRSQSANVPSGPVMRLKARARPMKQSPLLGRGASGEEVDANAGPPVPPEPGAGSKSGAKVARGKSDRRSPAAAAGRGRVIDLVRGPRGFGFTMRAIRVYTSEESDSYTLQHMVVAVEENSGAARCGVAPGELLVEVNGVRTEGLLHTDVLRLIVQAGGALRVRVLNINDSSIRAHRSRKKSAVHIRMVKPSAASGAAFVCKARHRGNSGGSDHSAHPKSGCSAASKEERKRTGGTGTGSGTGSGRTHHVSSSGSSLLRRLSAKRVAEKCRYLSENSGADAVADCSSTSASPALPLSLPPEAGVLRLRIPEASSSASTCSRGSSSASGRSSSGRGGSGSSTESPTPSPPLRTSTAPAATCCSSAAARPLSLYAGHQNQNQKQSPEHKTHSSALGTLSTTCTASTTTSRLGVGLTSLQRAQQQPLSPLARPHEEPGAAISTLKSASSAAAADRETYRRGKRGSWKETDL